MMEYIQKLQKSIFHESMKIHLVFHIFLFKSYKEPDIIGRKQPPPPVVIIDNQEEYEVEEVLNS